MMALPFPQRATVPSHLSARFVAPLTVAGYDFGALEPVELPDIAGGYLHRFVGYSFALEVPESSFLGSVDVAAPFRLQVENSATLCGEFAKPLQLGRYVEDAPLLEYVRTFQRDTRLRVRLSGRLLRDSVSLLGFASIAAVVTFHVQTLQDSQWAERFDRGEI
jgi:hypothetical protein